MHKEQLRQGLIQERNVLSSQKRDCLDRQILGKLQNWDMYQKAHKVMMYLSFGWEIDTWPILSDLENQGKQIYVPVVQNHPKSLQATLYTSKADLVPAVFGILEPKKGAPVIDPLELDLILVPGLAFSQEGFRIGYGGGYYDRFLATTEATTVGLVYSTFIRELKPDPWDQAVDFIATERGIKGRK